MFDIEQTLRASPPTVGNALPARFPTHVCSHGRADGLVESQVIRGVAMKGFVQDIESLATRNHAFRHVHHTRADAEADTEHFDGKTSEQAVES